MSDYTYRTFREEWKVEFATVDQYDNVQEVYETSTFPTKEAADTYLEATTKLQAAALRRVPINAPHGYCIARVRKHLEEVVPRKVEVIYDNDHNGARWWEVQVDGSRICRCSTELDAEKIAGLLRKAD